MAKFEKKGHDINVKGIVIHQIIKDAHTTLCNLKLAKQEIAPTDREKLFVANIKDSYYKKSNPTYGIFCDNDTAFRKALDSYVHGKSSFFDFSVTASKHYKLVISKSSPATGGHIIFVHFTNSSENQEYMLVMTTNNKDGFFIADDLSIKDVKNLDLSKIDVACLINITKWNNIINGNDTESKTYLSFVKGNKNISQYFMSFIDCNDNTTSTESTKRLIKAIEGYCKKEDYDREETIRKKNLVFQYCSDCIKQRKEIRLDAISALFDNENPNSFMEYAASEQNGVSEIISGDSKLLRKIKYVSYKSDDLTIIFDNDKLEKTVFYDKNKKQLTFKDLPEDLIIELEK